MRKLLLVMFVSWVVVLSPALAQQSILKVSEVGDWTVFSSDGEPKYCGIVAVANKMVHRRDGKVIEVSRSAGQLYMTYRADTPGIAQFGYMAGFPLSPSGEISAVIDGNKYDLGVYRPDSDPEWAWPRFGQDTRVESAMKQGNTIVVRSTSRRGTAVEDTFSLRGVTKGLESAGRECK